MFYFQRMGRDIALAVIPARGGSKGKPRKNLVSIAGKPLIAWTVEAAKNCPYILHTVVSSDDDEILSVAAQYGADVLKRPAELATDTTEAKPVLQHALIECEKRYGSLPKYVAYLQPTSPLRTAAHLTAAFETLASKHNADALVSVYEVDNSYLKSSIINADGYLEYAAKGNYANANRQSLPKLYMPNGAIYLMEATACKETPRFYGERTIPFVMSPEESIDIDGPEDISSVEASIPLLADA